MAFDVDTTTDEVVAGLDLSGQTIVVTGATSGLGLETARALASAGARVVLCGRDEEKGAVAMNQVSGDVSFQRLDLADLADVRHAAHDLRERLDRLDVLVNNAGVMACPFGHTADGFEVQFGTNHLGHFALTTELMPLLLASAPSRIVNLSSAGHQLCGVDRDDPNFERREYDPWIAYGQSKSANVLFTRELERRYGEQGVHAYAVHPGMVATELSRHMSREAIEALVTRVESRPSTGSSTRRKHVDTGAATQVWAATGDGIPGGAYLADCAVSDEVAPHARDDEAAAALWALSEELVNSAG
jgi:NAD(P)-dependent dehydrogenase (short-subunit alcohol dehydrogenase family)